MNLNKSLEHLLESNTVEEVLDILNEKEGDARYGEEKEECRDIVNELNNINDEIKDCIEAEDIAKFRMNELGTEIKSKLGDLKVRFPEVYTRDFVNNEDFKGLAKSRVNNGRKKVDKTASKDEIVDFLSKNGASAIKEIGENINVSISTAYGILRNELLMDIDSSEKDGNSILYRYTGKVVEDHLSGVEDLDDDLNLKEKGDFDLEEGDEYFNDVETEATEFMEED